MLKKLLKHEFRATSKMMLPLFGGALVLVGVTKILLFISGMMWYETQQVPENNTILRGIAMGFVMLTTMALLALLFVILISSALRFYKNLLGDEGYLMFTLPVTAGEQIVSKLIVSMCWTLGGILFSIGTMLLLTGGAANYSMVTTVDGAVTNVTAQTFGEAMQVAAAEMGGGIYWILPLLTVFIIVGMISQYLMLYTAMALGAQWPNNRLPASIGAYVGIGFGLQMFVFFGIIVAGVLEMKTGWLDGTVEFLSGEPMLVANGAFCVAIVGSILLSMVFFFVTRWLLSKKLNLA